MKLQVTSYKLQVTSYKLQVGLHLQEVLDEGHDDHRRVVEHPALVLGAEAVHGLRRRLEGRLGRLVERGRHPRLRLCKDTAEVSERSEACR